MTQPTEYSHVTRGEFNRAILWIWAYFAFTGIALTYKAEWVLILAPLAAIGIILGRAAMKDLWQPSSKP